MRIYHKKLLMVLFLAGFISGCDGCGGNSGAGGSADVSSAVAPTVSSTAPVNAATGVAINKKMAATFSEGMDPLTITTMSFLITGPDSTPVVGTVNMDATNHIAIFVPVKNLEPNTLFTATITTEATSLVGNTLVSDYAWTFTTGITADTTPPTVSSTSPVSAATDVAINRKIIVTFSEEMDPLTLTTTTFQVTGPGTTPVAGTVDYTLVGNIATFTPTSNLALNTLFTVTITAGTKDLTDNTLANDYVWSFTTGATVDDTAPATTSTSPASADTNVAINRKVTISFSEVMDASTITTATYIVTGPGTTPVTGTVDYTLVGNIATFTPASNFAPNTTFTVTMTTGVKDLAGNALASAYVWSFTTGTTVAAGPAPVVLGTAGNFVILTKSGITNVPTSAITGDIGTSPITGAAITGLGCPEVTGTVYTVDAAGPACRVTDDTLLTTAVSDMETAYTDAAGRAIPDFTELGAGEIGGLTIIPGLYKWSTNVLITTDVTLSGGPNDVWIFQIAGDLTQANGKSVNLAGGAQAKNIFWQVSGGTGVTIGTTAHLEGTILAIKAINLNTGASANGRLLAQTAVTLKQNTVTKP